MKTFNCSICGKSTNTPHTHELRPPTRWVPCRERMPTEENSYQVVLVQYEEGRPVILQDFVFWDAGRSSFDCDQQPIAWLDGVPEFAPEAKP